MPMENTDDDLHTDSLPAVEVVDDTPPEDRGRKPLNREVADPTDDELEQYSAGVKNRIRELTRARHDERRKAERLEREQQELARTAQALLEQNRQLQQRFAEGAKQFQATAAAGADLEVESARKALIAAQESFDPQAIAAAQEALFDAKAKLAKIKEVDLPPSAPAESVVQPRQVAAPRVSETTKQWMEQNTWFQAPGHEDMTSLAMGTHHKLVRAGIQPDTPEYFEQIDARMRKAFPEAFADDGGVDEEPVRANPVRRASPVAPAGRTPSRRVVKLSTSQIAVARQLGITPEQYAAQLNKD